jgi:hypothetical protein
MILVAATASVAWAGEAYYVSDFAVGSVWRLEDVNGDGDALDTDEKLLWADGFTLIGELAEDGGSLLAVELGKGDGSNQVIRLTDNNGDGDALDLGERIVWADQLDDPRGISRDSRGDWFVTEIDDDLVWRMVDVNGDGDVLDVGERSVYAVGIDGAATAMVIEGGILVDAVAGDQVRRLVDINDDGDALDVGENLVITPTIDQPLGLLDDGNGGFFFSSRSADTVYHAVDHNSDGDMLDLAEVLSYADAVYGDIDGPYDMAAHDSGGFLLADLFDGEVVLVRDANDDDDALDLGDVSLFADGFDSPVDIVAVSFFTADFDRDGDVDANDLTKWQGDYGGPGSDADGDGDSDGADFLAWQRQFTGTLSPPLSTANTVPEPLSTVLLFSLAAARFLYFSRIREIPSTSLKPPISMISRAL